MSVATSSSSASSSDVTVRYFWPPQSRRERLVRWYMGRVAGRFCPCEWPVKIRPLIRLCGRVDDALYRYEFHRFAAFHLGRYR